MRAGGRAGGGLAHHEADTAVHARGVPPALWARLVAPDVEWLARLDRDLVLLCVREAVERLAAEPAAAGVLRCLGGRRPRPHRALQHPILVLRVRMTGVREPSKVCVHGSKVSQRLRGRPIEWAFDETCRTRVITSWCDRGRLLDLFDVGGRHQACLAGCQCPCRYHPALGCVQGTDPHTLALSDAYLAILLRLERIQDLGAAPLWHRSAKVPCAESPASLVGQLATVRERQRRARLDPGTEPQTLHCSVRRGG